MGTWTPVVKAVSFSQHEFLHIRKLCNHRFRVNRIETKKWSIFIYFIPQTICPFSSSKRDWIQVVGIPKRPGVEWAFFAAIPPRLRANCLIATLQHTQAISTKKATFLQYLPFAS